MFKITIYLKYVDFLTVIKKKKKNLTDPKLLNVYM